MVNPKNDVENKDFRKELSGAIYQIKIILLLLWQGLKNNCKFRLRTEVEDAAKFDDALFYHLKENGKFGIKFLQMKHARFDEARLKYGDFVNDYETSRCNLKKYFISFRKILQQFKEEDLDDFILCTNIPFSSLKLKRKETDSDEKALIFEEQTIEKETLFGSIKHGEWKQYKLIQINGEVENIFKSSTNLSCLAEEFIKCITKSENEGKKEVELDIRNYWFSLYHFALFNDYVIEEQENVRFKWKFINDFSNKKNDLQNRLIKTLTSEIALKYGVKEDELDISKELTAFKLDKRFKEICNSRPKNVNEHVENDDLKRLAATLITHVLKEHNLHKLFDGDSLLLEAINKMKDKIYDSEIELCRNVDEFCIKLEDLLSEKLKNFTCGISYDIKCFFDFYKKQHNDENYCETPMETNSFHNLAKLLVENSFQLSNLTFREYSVHATLLKKIFDFDTLNTIKLPHVLHYFDEISEYQPPLSAKFNDVFWTNQHSDEEISKFRKYLITFYATHLLREREYKIFPRLLADHILGFKSTEVICTYLLNPILFNQFKNSIEITKENVVSDNFISGNNFKDNAIKFRNILLNSYLKNIAESLVHQEFAARHDFKELLLNKKNDNADIAVSTENLKNLAKELASYVCKKICLIRKPIFEESKIFLNHVFEVRGIKNVAFSGNFLNISQKKFKDKNLEENLKRLHRYLLKSYAIQKLKNVTFLLTDNFGQKPSRPTFEDYQKNTPKLAEELIEIMKNTKSKGGSNAAIFYDRTKYGKNDTKGLIEMLLKTVFDVSIISEEKQFQKILDDDESKLLPEAVVLRKILKERLTENDFNYLKNCEIKITNEPPFYETLEEIRDIDEDIKCFCKKLIIVNTPNETALTEVMEKEISQKFSLIDSDIAADFLLIKILNWAKEKEEKFLDQQDAETFMKDIQLKITNSLITGINSSYCAKLRSYRIVFKKFLRPSLETITEQILVLKTDETLLTAIKVEQTLRHFYGNKNNYNIISTTALLLIQNEVLANIESIIDILIIVDKLRKHERGVFLNFWKNLCSVVEKYPAKKVIFIAETPLMVDIIFQKIFKDKKIYFNNLSKKSQKKLKALPFFIQEKAVDNSDIIIKLKKLIGSQIIMDYINNGEIHIGRPMQLFTEKNKKCYIKRKINLMRIDNEIICDNYSDNHIFLIEGADGTSIEDCQAFVNSRANFSDIPSINVNNEKCASEKELSDITCIIMIFNMDKKTCSKNVLHKFKKNGNIENILMACFQKRIEKNCQYNFFVEVPKGGFYSHEIFQYLCKNYLKRNVYWLKLNNDLLYFNRSNTNKINFIKSRFVKNDVLCNVSIEEEYVLERILNDKVLIICDKAGMGKSSILTHFCQKLEETIICEAKWKIRINLNFYTDVLSKIKHQKNCEADELKLNFCTNRTYEEVILRSLINAKTPEDKLSFEDHVFEYCFKNGKMLIIFDGFDEICPDYENYVTQLLLKIKSETQNQIWITSRTNFKETLENNLQSYAFDMKPFDKEDQKEFLIKFWNTEWEKKHGSQIKDQDRLKNYVNILLKHFYKTIGAKHVHEIGIPLQTKMLAEIFQENRDLDEDNNETLQWHGCFDFIENDTLETPEFSNKIKNLFVLYETFVQQKILTYFLKKKKILDLDKPFNTKLKHMIYNYEQKIHQILGLMVMTDNKIKMESSELPTETEREETKIWLSDFRKGTENIGLIDSMSPKGIPLFNHLTYGEYFTACYFKEKLLLTPKAAFEVINNILKKDVPIFLYCLKYYLLPNENESIGFNLEDFHRKIKEPKLVNYFSKHGFYHCLKYFLSFNEFKENILSEKTLLHYAVESNQINILLCVLSGIYGLFEADEPTVYLSFFLNLISSCKNFNKRKLIKSVVEELKEFCQYGLNLKQSDIKTVGDILNYMPNNYEYFFSSSHKNFCDIFSCETIRNILNQKRDAYLGPTISITEFITSIFANKRLCEIEKLKIFEDMCKEIAEDQKQICISHITKMAIKYEYAEIFTNFWTNFFEEIDMSDTCFALACQLNNIDIIKIILTTQKDKKYTIGISKGIQIGKEKSLGNSPLHVAVYYNVFLDIIQYIVEETGSNIDAKNDNNKTLLMIAVKSNASFNKIIYLLNRGADINVKDMYGKTAFSYAISENDDKMIKLFLTKPNLRVSKKCKETIEEFYNLKNFDINHKTNGLTRLHQAINAKDEILSEFLIKNGADINKVDGNGKTPIKSAYGKGLTEIVKLLEKQERLYGLHNNFSYDLSLTKFEKNKDGTEKTAMIHQNATLVKQNYLYFNKPHNNCKFKAIKASLFSGANIDNLKYEYKDADNAIKKIFNTLTTLFDYLYYEQYDEFQHKVNEIIDCDFFWNVPDYKENTVFDYILQTNNYNLVKYCLMKGASITPELTSENENIQTLFSFILKCFEIISGPKYEPQSVIKYIEKSGYTEVITRVRCGFVTREPLTLLQLAENKKEKEIMDWLIENGADEKMFKSESL